MGFGEEIEEFLLGFHVQGVFHQRNADEGGINWSLVQLLAFQGRFGL